jgi:hypothetical protein
MRGAQARPVRRVLLVVAAVTAGAVVVGGGALYLHRNSNSAKLRRAYERLTPPPGWVLMGRNYEPGSSSICIVSCPKAEMTLLYRASGSHEQACEVMRRQIEAEVASTQPAPALVAEDCGWAAPLPSVGGGAVVTADTTPAHFYGAQSGWDWIHPVDPGDKTTYVAVGFSGGPT